MLQYALWIFLFCTASHAVASSSESSRTDRVRQEVQPILKRMAEKWNMSFTFGFADDSGRVGLSAGLDNIWNMTIPLHRDDRKPFWPRILSKRHLLPDTVIPMGSVTKPWTGLHIMKYVEEGRISLDDEAHIWIDPVLSEVWGSSLHDLWGPDSSSVTIRDLLSMRSGFADYNDEVLMTMTMVRPGDDVDPWMYLKSASRVGWVCKPRTCGTYSGANFVLLGLVLVNLHGSYSWEEFDQRTVIPKQLWNAGRYQNTRFLKFGRCLQYHRIAHQWAVPYVQPPDSKANVSFVDLATSSCLNGWTMGNIASTGEDLATFFYDVFALAGTGKGYVNSTTLQLMQQWQPLNDTWCEGPQGEGSCQYGLAFFRDQFAQDIWVLKDPSQSLDSVRVIGHPGEDWGSGCSPCGYNKAFNFGICVGYNSLQGMNCSMDWNLNSYATYEATCLIYDAVLSIAGGPRLDCSLPEVSKPQYVTCEWRPRQESFIGPHPHPGTRRKNPSSVEQVAKQLLV
mmetsp:Transcript_128328/g.247323  ORF Transcript_128328/g.247323 Transcript_128328/m.247323 type:complete len:508 (+) Transcript_128328:101-1624(+)